MLVFVGTADEFKEVASILEAYDVPGDEKKGSSAEPEEAEAADSIPTFEEALKAIQYHGGLSRNQREVLRVLAEADEPVGSNAIQAETGLTGPQMRGVMGCLPRRARGAIGSDRRLVDKRWVEWKDGRWQNEYWLPDSVREAFEETYGDN